MWHHRTWNPVLFIYPVCRFWHRQIHYPWAPDAHSQCQYIWVRWFMSLHLVTPGIPSPAHYLHFSSQVQGGVCMGQVLHSLSVKSGCWIKGLGFDSQLWLLVIWYVSPQVYAIKVFLIVETLCDMNLIGQGMLSQGSGVRFSALIICYWCASPQVYR